MGSNQLTSKESARPTTDKHTKLSRKDNQINKNLDGQDSRKSEI